MAQPSFRPGGSGTFWAAARDTSGPSAPDTTRPWPALSRKRRRVMSAFLVSDMVVLLVEDDSTPLGRQAAVEDSACSRRGRATLRVSPRTAHHQGVSDRSFGLP